MRACLILGLMTATLLSSCGAPVDSTSDTTLRLDGIWSFRVDSANVGEAQRWYEMAADRASWDTITVPMHWDSHKLAQYDGRGWYAKNFDITARGNVRYAVVFDAVDDNAVIWFNGVRIGSHSGYGQRFFFDITALLRPKGNVLVARVEDLAGPGGMIGSVKVMAYTSEDDLIESDWYRRPVVQSPAWVRDAVVYEIFTRNFSKDGSFAAVEQRIPELRALGVTVLWLMPIHPIGEKNRKGTLGSPYSVRDYYGVNPEHGTMDDLRSLVRAAHAAGMRVIIDIVANHTAWDNPLIDTHPDWYTRDAKGEIIPPNTDWHDVADLDYSQPALRQYMTDMLAFWIDSAGLDGFRCDVAEMVPHDFWVSAFSKLRVKKPLLLLAEGTTPDLHVDAFDMTYAWNTYDILPGIFAGRDAAGSIDEALRRERLLMPLGALRLRFTTNHDKHAYDAPAVTRYGVDGAKAAAVLIHCLPGVPLIYNGQEVGSTTKLGLFDRDPIDWSRDTHGFRALYTELNVLRRDHEALRRGVHIPKSVEKYPSLYLGLRELDGEQIFFAVNLGASPIEVTVPDAALAGFTRLFGNAAYSTDTDRLGMKIPGYGYFIGNKSRR